MTVVRQFKVKSRLSEQIGRPGGITVGQALKQAEVAMEALRPPCLEDIDATLAAIEQRFGPAVKRGGEPLSELYTLSLRIIDSSIALPSSGIDKAAKALCNFIDRSEQAGVEDWAAVDIHLSTLKLLRRAGSAMTPEQRASVLEGLANVTRKRARAAPGPERRPLTAPR